MARVAAIDCGTNSIRLLVADVTIREDGTAWLRDVHREMRVVRLGQGVDASGVLAAEAIKRTADALADYTAIARRKGVERVRMVATSATRDATNRDDFFTMTESVLGVRAEVITGDEEARLSFTGAVGDFDPDGGPFVVTDVGGGSTEVVTGTWDGVQAKITAARSVDIGCVRLTERCLRSSLDSGDPPTREEVSAAAELARTVLAEAFEAVPVGDARTWIGVAGTVTTLTALAKRLIKYDPDAIHQSTVDFGTLAATTEQLLTSSHEQRAAIPVIHPGRVDVIGGGAIVVATLAGQLRGRAGIEVLTASEHDILDGIALSLV